MEDVDRYDLYSFLDLGTADGQAKFGNLFFSPEGLKKEPAKRIIYSIFREAVGTGGLCVIVENEYMDREYSIAYARTVARAFKDHPRKCTRFHFLSRVLSGDDLERQPKEIIEMLSGHYLGYTVLFPGSDGVLGRTLIDTRCLTTPERYVPCAARFHVGLLGVKYSFRAVPYIQQDRRIGACASAALWMATTAMSNSERFQDLAARTMAELTELAVGQLFGVAGVPVPSSGLRANDMLTCLNKLGYDTASVHQVKSAGEANDVLYKHVESGLAPILSIRLRTGDLHAATVFGHTYDGSATHSKGPSDLGIPSWKWCPSFVANDDQMGPALLITLYDRADGRVGFHVDTGTANDSVVDSLLGFYGSCPILETILIPRPPRIFLSGKEAEIKASVLALSVIRVYVKPLQNETANLVFRTFLVSATTFKEDFAKRLPESKIYRLYRLTPMPKYVWITEIGTVSQRANHAAQDIKIVGEILVDPGSTPNDFHFVAVNLPGYFTSTKPTDHSLDEIAERLEKYSAVRTTFEYPAFGC